MRFSLRALVPGVALVLAVVATGCAETANVSSPTTVEVGLVAAPTTTTTITPSTAPTTSASVETTTTAPTSTTDTTATTVGATTTTQSTTTTTPPTTTTQTTPTITPPTTTTTPPTTTTTTADPAKTVDVSIESFMFVPATVTINVGDTVRWTVNSGTHTATSNSGVWDSNTMATGEVFTFTFDQAGDYPYICTLHPSMQATVTVEQ